MMQKRVFTIFNHLPNIRAAYETIISKASKGNEEYALSYCSCNLNKKSFQHSGGFNPCIDRDICVE